MFERLKAALTGRGGQPRAVPAALLPIKASDAQLYERCVAFVEDGSGPEVLTALASRQDPDLPELTVWAGKYEHHWFIDRRSTDRLKELGFRSHEDVLWKRFEFYVGPTAGTPDQLIRFARVITIAGGGPNRRVDDVPDWFVALVNDLMVSTGRNGSYNQKAELGELASSRWTPDFLAHLLALDSGLGAGEQRAIEAVAAVLFEDIVDAQHAPPHPSLLTGTQDWLRRYGSRIGATFGRRLTANGRVRLLTSAGQDPSAADAVAPLIAAWTIDSAKSVRAAALPVFARFSSWQRATTAASVLATAPASNVGDLVALLAADPVLTQAVADNPKITAAVEKISARQAVLDAAADQPELELPPYEPLPDTVDREAVRAELRSFLAAERAHQEPSGRDNYRRRRAAKITNADVEEFLDVATGVHDLDRSEGRFAVNIARELHLGFVVDRLPALGMLGRIRVFMKLTPRNRWALTQAIEPDTDLRALAEVVTRLGGDDDRVVQLYLSGAVEPEAAWPWFVGHTELLDGWLKAGGYDAATAFRLLAASSSLPAELVPTLAGLASGSARTARVNAQQLLAHHPAARGLAEHGLTDGSSELRAGAARWLAALGDPAAIAALQSALGKEKREVPRAAMLAALEALGDDVSEHLTPELLLKDARKGLRGKRPASLAWFAFDQLPATHWSDGSPVEPDIISWWVILADKLKNPDGSGLLDRYLGLLADADAVELGRFALRSWIAEDTRRPTVEESRAYATTEGTRAYQNAQVAVQRARSDPNSREYLEYFERGAAIPVDQHIATYFDIHQATYNGSASADKGLLALTTRVPGIELAQAVNGYIRDHGARRAQVDMLVRALYGNGSPAALQVLLRIARRFHQATVQATALQLVEQLADDRGWTPDELADRTVPTAGFGDDRLLHLDFGPREFIGRITSGGTIALSNPDGKPIKSLPKPRADDDQELAAAARKQLTVSRKELKAVLSLQTARLYESMCVQRTWAVADWQEYLAGHPLLTRVVSSLVWLEFPAIDGEPAPRSFRPTEDGALIDLADDQIQLADTSRIGLAHRLLLSDDEVAGWQQHLRDYEVQPAFEQLSNGLPDLDPESTAVTDLRGHLTDTFSFRSVATKRGYQRGAVEDAAWFLDYRKTFSSIGLVAVIDFTGSFLPEENIPCATERLSFVRGRRSVPLSEVPTVLLAEGYADWAALAALGPYDPDYRNTTQY